MGALPIKDIQTLADDSPVMVAGLVVGVRRTMTKNGQPILIAQIEDPSAGVEVVVFAKLYPQVHELFRSDAVLTIKGRLRIRERRGAPPGEEAPLEVSISVNEVETFVGPPVPAPAPPAWHVQLGERGQIDRLAALIDEWPGDVPVVLHARGRSQRASRTISGDTRIRRELEGIFGTGAVDEGALEENSNV
jgi:hypothetical protein